MSESSSALFRTLEKFFSVEQPQARRVFHGRGHCYPGLEHVCVDWYPPVLLISLYEEMSEVEQVVSHALNCDTPGQIAAVMVQRRYEKGTPAEFLYGHSSQSIVVTENDLQFEVHPGRRQNAGLFMDMRLVRRWLMRNSNDCNVLNLFAYTCSLSVAALAGGAKSVTNVDVSKTSIAWGQRNHELNGQSLERVRSIPHNLFTSWGRIKQFGRYDLVIIDPPTRQRGSFEAEKNYGAVVKRLQSLCHPQAQVIACLNSPFLDTQWLLDLFAEHCQQAIFEDCLPVAPEYADQKPERGLKICRFRMAAANPGGQ